LAKPTPEQIKKALEQSNGNKAAAAEALGCSRWDVWNYAKTTKIEGETAAQRKLRETERKLTKVQDQLKDETKRRELAESDLEDALEQNDLIRDLDEHDLMVRELEAFSRSNTTEGGCTAIICATDWHLEKNVVPSTVSGLNEFNLDIAEKRINQLWRKSAYMIDLWRNVADVDEVLLWLGGDLMNNYLHDEDVESNFCGPTEAVLAVQEHVATGLDFLAENDCAVDRVVTNYGNHGRSTRYMRPATGWKTSWEYLAYRNLERWYPHINWQITHGYLNYQDVQGYKVRFHHGENVKYYGGVGGLSIPMNKAVQAWDKSRRADLSISGHFHQYLDYWSWVSCGCLCGMDAYAQSIKAEYQEPTQTIVFIDKSRGKVQSIPIFVDKPHVS
jgi:hypothetical protein